ncbi:MAG: methylated-DNA--[protein]-cysteine S-methyltransferase [Planctomycetota bacterium]|nr:methylated-DNA--[protein]-cysteine S-methyltransferase [Planctomycetota bacterium]
MTTTTVYSHIDSQMGPLLVRGDGESVTGLYMAQHKRCREPDPSWRRSDESFAVVREQLAEYFAGERTAFDVPIKLVGGPFQQRVWEELVRIPFGETITYGQLAHRVGNPKASRAVGHANGRNPVAIIVPCHRVIGANGTLTGYAGGLENKQWLLAWERGEAPAEAGGLFGAERGAESGASSRA